MNNFGQVLEDESLKKYTTFSVGGKAKYVIKPFDEKSFIELIKYLNDKKIKYFLLGNGSNVILEDGYFNGVIIKFDNFKDINLHDNEVEVGSGVVLPFLVNYLLNNGYTNLYFLHMIPGTVGGSVVGNAGCYKHEIMEYVKSVKVLDKEGNVKILDKNDISFGYRFTSLKDKYIVLSVTFVLEKGDVIATKTLMEENREKRNSTQPITSKCVGSIFRNPEGDYAGRLIESCNLKGYSINDAKVSEKHANFIVNEQNASFNDIVTLIDLIKEKVKKEHNISLVLEPSIVRWDEI